METAQVKAAVVVVPEMALATAEMDLKMALEMAREIAPAPVIAPTSIAPTSNKWIFHDFIFSEINGSVDLMFKSTHS